MKYLEVVLDGGWNYYDHFNMVANKVERTIGMLNKLMPNIRGVSEHKRKLYANVVASIFLYGAPIWYRAMEDRRIDGSRMASQERSRKKYVELIGRCRAQRP